MLLGYVISLDRHLKQPSHLIYQHHLGINIIK